VIDSHISTLSDKTKRVFFLFPPPIPPPLDEAHRKKKSSTFYSVPDAVLTHRRDALSLADFVHGLRVLSFRGHPIPPGVQFYGYKIFFRMFPSPISSLCESQRNRSSFYCSFKNFSSTHFDAPFTEVQGLFRACYDALWWRPFLCERAFDNVDLPDRRVVHDDFFSDGPHDTTRLPLVYCHLLREYFFLFLGTALAFSFVCGPSSGLIAQAAIRSATN